MLHRISGHVPGRPGLDQRWDASPGGLMLTSRKTELLFRVLGVRVSGSVVACYGELRLYPWVWGPFRDHFRKPIGNMGAILVVYWQNPLGLRP